MSTWLILWLVSSCSIEIHTREDSSGDGFFPTLHPQEACSVPAYSRPAYEVNATEGKFQLLLTEGKCFLSCLQYYYYDGMYETVFTTYSVWPFATVNVGCDAFDSLHECTRGCRIFIQDTEGSQGCRESCVRECQAECGNLHGCTNPDSTDSWVIRGGCYISCRYPILCTEGCDTGPYILDPGHPPPDDPLAPPNLTEVNDTDRGMFSINLTAAAGDRMSSEFQILTGFLFKIHEVSSTNSTYIWQSDPRQLLNLMGHICREVEVSFAVVNEYGISSFSDPVRFFISGDPLAIPNAATNVRIEEHQDTRNSFFAHVQLIVSWSSPEVDTHLNYFVVALEKAQSSNGSQDNCGVMKSKVYSPSFRLNNNNGSDYSHTLQAILPGSTLLMGCRYQVEVLSVGPDGNRSTTSEHNTLSLEEYMAQLLSFTVTKEIAVATDISSAYFKFFFNWVVQENMASRRYIETFKISSFVVAMGPTEHIFRSGTHPQQFEGHINVTEYIARFTTFDNLYIPRLDSTSFKFELSMRWNRDELLAEPPPENYRFVSRTDTKSPGPSEVLNVLVTGKQLVGDDSMHIQAEWTPPLYANGVLRSYKVCLSISPLVGDLDVSMQINSRSTCLSFPHNTTSIDTVMMFVLSRNHAIFLQVRGENKYTGGNWSEAFSLSLITSTTLTEQRQTDKPEVSPNAQEGLMLSEAVGVAVGAAAVFSIAVFLVCICTVAYIKIFRRRKRLMNLAETTPNFVLPLTGITFNAATTGTMRPLDLHSEPQEQNMEDEWEINPTQVTIEDPLGEGAFGEVYKGYLKGPLGNCFLKPEHRSAVIVPVAVKLLKDTAEGSERQDFLSEIEMMKKVSESHNPHVVAMLGCVTTQEPLCLLTELVEFGDLLSYLRSSRKIYITGSSRREDDPYLILGQLSPIDLPSFSYQIAAGMAYLSSIGIVHRDLACRNILVNADKALKITDFGMSREVEEMYVQRSSGRVPLKWMAIESIIAREFTSASDVWSFGVVLWEIGTIGGVPYPGTSNAELLPLLKRGYRMEKPDNCSSELYEIMLSCWQEDAGKRLTFADLKIKFNDILLSQGSSDYVDFMVNPKEAYYNTEEDDVNLPKKAVPPTISLSPAVSERSLKVPNQTSRASLMLGNSGSPQKQYSNLNTTLGYNAAHSVKDLRGQSKEQQISASNRNSKIVSNSHSQECVRNSGETEAAEHGVEEESDGRYVRDPMLRHLPASDKKESSLEVENGGSDTQSIT